MGVEAIAGGRNLPSVLGTAAVLGAMVAPPDGRYEKPGRRLL